MEHMIIDTTTGHQREMYHRFQTKQKLTPDLPGSEWELPITITYDMTHGPRAAALNGELLVETALGGFKNVASNVLNEANRLLGKRDCGGFQ